MLNLSLSSGRQAIIECTVECMCNVYIWLVLPNCLVMFLQTLHLVRILKKKKVIVILLFWRIIFGKKPHVYFYTVVYQVVKRSSNAPSSVCVYYMNAYTQNLVYISGVRFWMLECMCNVYICGFACLVMFLQTLHLVRILKKKKSYSYIVILKNHFWQKATCLFLYCHQVVKRSSNAPSSVCVV